jgi:hypothetical protein
MCIELPNVGGILRFGRKYSSQLKYLSMFGYSNSPRIKQATTQICINENTEIVYFLNMGPVPKFK